MPLPNFESWAVFARVADLGSFAAAAKELGLSTATVSKAVSRLERQIGATLLSRSSRRLSLTTLGQELVGRAAHMLLEAEQIETYALDRTAVPRGLVRIAVPMSFGQQQVAPLLPGLLQALPEIAIDLHLGDELVDLIGSGFDLALRIARLETSSLRVRHICDIRLLLVAAPHYARSGGLPAHPRQLPSHPCFGYAYLPTANRWNFTHQDGEQLSVELTGPLRANNGEAVLPSLLAGLGIAALPDFLVWEALQAGQLVRLMPDWALPTSALSLVMPPAILRPARVTAVIDALHLALSQAPWASVRS